MWYNNDYRFIVCKSWQLYSREILTNEINQMNWNVSKELKAKSEKERKPNVNVTKNVTVDVNNKRFYYEAMQLQWMARTVDIGTLPCFDMVYGKNGKSLKAKG